MMYEESIYNLIPKEAYVPPKEKRYKSRHPATMPPTASTFGLKTTSKIIGNFEGAVQPGEGSHTNKGNGLTFGQAKGKAKPDVTQPLKKQTGTFKLPESKRKFRRNRLDFLTYFLLQKLLSREMLLRNQTFLRKMKSPSWASSLTRTTS